MTVTTPNYLIEVFDRSDTTTPVDTLTALIAADFADLRNDVGSGSVTVNNDDAAELQADRLLRYTIRGVPAATLVLDVPEVVDLAPDPNDQDTTARGTGHVALWAEGRCTPPYLDRLAAGEVLRPKVLDRPLDYRDPAFDPTGSFVAATEIRTQDSDPAPTGWRSGPDSIGIWTSDGADAPEEIRYFRSPQPGDTGELVVPGGVGQIALFLTADNGAQPYLDGIHLEAQPASGTVTSSIIVDVTPGYHLVAIEGSNAAGGSPNPAYVQCVVHEWLGGDHLGAILAATSSDWLVSDASNPPSLNAVEAMQLFLDDNQSIGKLTGLTVAAMDTFPVQTGVVGHVGDDLLAFLKYLHDGGYCDFRMDPGSLELQLWPYGGQGSSSSLATLQAPTDPDDNTSGNLSGLKHTGERQTATALLVDYPDGWRYVDAVSPSGAEKLGLTRYGSTDVTAIDSVAASILSLTASPREQVTAGHAIHAATPDAEHPYTQFIPGDTVTAAAVEQRVQQITGNLNVANNFFEFGYELNDVIAEAAERQVQALTTFAGGDVGGRTSAASPSLSSPSQHGGAPAPAKHVYDFSNNGDELTTGVSASHPVEHAGYAHTCRAVINDGVDPTGSDTDFDISYNGSSWGTLTVPGGQVEGLLLIQEAVAGGAPNIVVTPTTIGTPTCGDPATLVHAVVEVFVS